MAIPDAARDLIRTKLTIALDATEQRANQMFTEVGGMLAYAMVIGHLDPREYSDWQRVVELQKERRQYRAQNKKPSL